MADFYSVQLEVDASGAVKGYMNASAAAQNFGKAGMASSAQVRTGLTQVDATTKLVMGSMNALRHAILGAGVAFAGMGLAQFINESVKLASRYETLGVTLTALGRQAGIVGPAMLGLAASTQAMGISMTEARQNIAVMIESQIDLANANKLARVAQDAAVIGNLNSSETFTRMTHAIQSGSVLILRNIGLNVSFRGSYEKLAHQIGKTAETLTEQEKVQARANAVIEKGKVIQGTYEAAMGTAGKQVLSMQRYVSDLMTVLGDAALPAFTQLVFGVSGVLKGAVGVAKEYGEALKYLANFAALAATAALAFGLQLLWVKVQAIQVSSALMGNLAHAMKQFAFLANINGASASAWAFATTFAVKSMLVSLGLLGAALGVLTLLWRDYQLAAQTDRMEIESSEKAALAMQARRLRMAKEENIARKEGYASWAEFEKNASKGDVGAARTKITDWLLGLNGGVLANALGHGKPEDEAQEQRRAEQTKSLKEALILKQNELAVERTLGEFAKDRLRTQHDFQKSLREMQKNKTDTAENIGLAAGARGAGLQIIAERETKANRELVRSIRERIAASRAQIAIDNEQNPVIQAKMEAFSELRKEWEALGREGKQTYEILLLMGAAFNAAGAKAENEQRAKTVRSFTEVLTGLQRQAVDTALAVERMGDAMSDEDMDTIKAFISRSPGVKRAEDDAVRAETRRRSDGKLSAMNPEEERKLRESAHILFVEQAYKQGREIGKAMDEGIRDSHAQNEADLREALAKTFDTMRKGAQQAMSSLFDSIFSGGITRMDQLADAIRATFLKLAADLAAMKMVNPLIDKVLGRPDKDGQGNDIRVGGIFGNDGWASQHKNAAGSIVGGVTGAAVGYQTGSPLAGAASGALAGAQFGPVGAVVGGLAGLAGGLFGMAKAAKEHAEAVRKAAEEVMRSVDSYTATGITGQVQGERDRAKTLFDALKKSIDDGGMSALTYLQQRSEVMKALQSRLADMARSLEDGIRGAYQDAFGQTVTDFMEATARWLNDRLKDLGDAVTAGIMSAEKAQELQALAQATAEKRLADELRRREMVTQQQTGGLEVRMLAAQGKSVAASDLSAQLANAKELFDAIAANASPELLDLIRRTQEAEKTRRDEERAYTNTASREDSEVRRLAATGRTREADAMAFRLQQEREYRDAERAGLDAATLAALRLAQQAEAAKRAADEAYVAQQAIADLEVRRLNALGKDSEGADLAFQLKQEREFKDAMNAGMSQEYLDKLKQVQELELKARNAAKAAGPGEAAANPDFTSGVSIRGLQSASMVQMDTTNSLLISANIHLSRLESIEYAVMTMAFGSGYQGSQQTTASATNADAVMGRTQTFRRSAVGQARIS